MSGDFLSNLWDDATIAVAAYTDVVDNLNPFSDSFLSGEAKNTALTAEVQNAERENRPVDVNHIISSGKDGVGKIGDAANDTVSQVLDKVEDATSFGLKALPWVLGAVAAVGLLAVAAPYVSPVLRRI